MSYPSVEIVQYSPLSLTIHVFFFCDSLGYDLEFFGFFREYLFFPWLAMIFLVFIVTEVRVSRANKRQVETIAKRGI